MPASLPPPGVVRPLSDPPFVTVVAPMRNEQGVIEGFLECLTSQTYPKDRLEVLIVNGESSDESPRIVERFAESHSWIKLISNPAQCAAAAMNAGIRAAQHDIIVRLDCHSQYEPNYIWNSVELLLGTPGAGSVGGLQSASGEGRLQGVIAVAMAERFASGDAAYRTAIESQWTDTVYLGAWQKATLAEVGGFDSNWRINEDYELNIRLREAGYGVLLSPAVRSTYFPRKSLGSLARQYRAYGFWRAKTVMAHPSFLRWRQLAPPIVVVATATCLILTPWTSWPLLIPALYILALAIASGVAAVKSRIWDFPIFAAVFATMHFSWGLGFLGGAVVWGSQRRSLVAAKRVKAE